MRTVTYNQRLALSELVLATLLFLASCSTPPVIDEKPRDPIFVGTTVPVVVRERCAVELPVEPAWQVEVVPSTATPFEKSKAALAELEQRRDYLNQVRAVIKKCE